MDTAWNIGDLAACLSDNDEWDYIGHPEIPPIPGPKLNEINAVTWVGDDEGYLSLSFARYGDERWLASEFRRIKADEKKACEPEFVTLLERFKQTVSA